MNPPTVHKIGDIQLSVYYMGAGDQVPRHQHPVPHMTCVVVGRARIVIFSDPPQTTLLTWTDPQMELPAYIDHEITSLSDGTVIMNGMDLSTLPASEPQQQTQAGVALHDGTVCP